MGVKLGTGFSGSAVGNLYGGYTGASVPAASSVPEGPSTITQQAFGVPPAGAEAPRGLHAAAIGTIALILLGLMWWTLPRLQGRERSLVMDFRFGSFVLGIVAYWAFQHFTGMGNTGKSGK